MPAIQSAACDTQADWISGDPVVRFDQRAGHPRTYLSERGAKVGDRVVDIDFPVWRCGRSFSFHWSDRPCLARRFQIPPWYRINNFQKCFTRCAYRLGPLVPHP